VSLQEERLERLDLSSLLELTEVIDSLAEGSHGAGFSTAGRLVPSDEKRVI
jgi:hypothetical protein